MALERTYPNPEAAAEAEKKMVAERNELLADRLPPCENPGNLIHKKQLYARVRMFTSPGCLDEDKLNDLVNKNKLLIEAWTELSESLKIVSMCNHRILIPIEILFYLMNVAVLKKIAHFR